MIPRLDVQSDGISDPHWTQASKYFGTTCLDQVLLAEKARREYTIHIKPRNIAVKSRTYNLHGEDRVGLFSIIGTILEFTSSQKVVPECNRVANRVRAAAAEAATPLFCRMYMRQAPWSRGALRKRQGPLCTEARQHHIEYTLQDQRVCRPFSLSHDIEHSSF